MIWREEAENAFQKSKGDEWPELADHDDASMRSDDEVWWSATIRRATTVRQKDGVLVLGFNREDGEVVK